MKRILLFSLGFALVGAVAAWGAQGFLKPDQEGPMTPQDLLDPLGEGKVIYVEANAVRTLPIEASEESRVLEESVTNELMNGVSYVLARGHQEVLVARKSGKGLPDAWLLDSITGEARKIFSNVSMAEMSPDGSLIAVTSERELHLLTRDGVYVGRVGVHAGDAAFSPDGQYLAYMRLSDDPADLDLGDPEMFQGVSLYEIATGEDYLIFPAVEGLFGVSSWSPDGNRIYVKGTVRVRENYWHTALFSIDSQGNDYRLEVHPEDFEEQPAGLHQDTLWIESPRMAVSEGNGIWLFEFDDSNHVINATRLAAGDNLQWINPQETFTFRRNIENEITWVVVVVSDLAATERPTDFFNRIQ